METKSQDREEGQSASFRKSPLKSFSQLTHVSCLQITVLLHNVKITVLEITVWHFSDSEKVKVSKYHGFLRHPVYVKMMVQTRAEKGG